MTPTQIFRCCTIRVQSILSAIKARTRILPRFVSHGLLVAFLSLVVVWVATWGGVGNLAVLATVLLVVSVTVEARAVWLDHPLNSGVARRSLESLRLLIIISVTAIYGVILFLLLGALMVGHDGSKGIWTEQEAVAGAFAAIAGIAIAALGVVLATAERRLSDERTSFRRFSRRLDVHLGELGIISQDLWRLFHETTHGLSRSVRITLSMGSRFSGSRLSQEFIDEVDIHETPSVVASLLRLADSDEDPDGLDELLTNLQSVGDFRHADELQWTGTESRRTLRALRRAYFLGLVPGRTSGSFGLYPTSEFFLAECFPSNDEHAFVDPSFGNEALVAAEDLLVELRHRASELRREADELIQVLSQEVVEYPLEESSLVADFTLFNRLVPADPLETSDSRRRQAARIRLLQYGMTLDGTFSDAPVHCSSGWRMGRAAAGYGAYISALCDSDDPSLAVIAPPIYFASEFRRRVDRARTEAHALLTASLRGPSGTSAPRTLEEEWRLSVAAAFAAELTFARSPLANWWRAALADKRRLDFLDPETPKTASVYDSGGERVDRMVQNGGFPQSSDARVRRDWPLIRLIDQGAPVASASDRVSELAATAGALPRGSQPTVGPNGTSRRFRDARRIDVIPLGEVADALDHGSPYLRAGFL